MIVVLGMAGAGKSTQCRRLRDEFGYQWLPVGELLRAHRTEDQRLEMMHGLILDDNAVQPLVDAEMKRLGDDPEILLDGCPRTAAQATWLARGETHGVRCILHLVIPDEVAMKRLLTRGREDDNETAMKKRFAGYHRDIGGVLAEFTEQGIVVYEINAELPANDVFGQIKKVLS